jgi:hypothetical protein
LCAANETGPGGVASRSRGKKNFPEEVENYFLAFLAFFAFLAGFLAAFFAFFAAIVIS